MLISSMIPPFMSLTTCFLSLIFDQKISLSTRRLIVTADTNFPYRSSLRFFSFLADREALDCLSSTYNSGICKLSSGMSLQSGRCQPEVSQSQFPQINHRSLASSNANFNLLSSNKNEMTLNITATVSFLVPMNECFSVFILDASYNQVIYMLNY